MYNAKFSVTNKPPSHCICQNTQGTSTNVTDARCLVISHMAEKWAVNEAHHAHVPLRGRVHLSVSALPCFQKLLFTNHPGVTITEAWNFCLFVDIVFLFGCLVVIFNVNKSLKPCTCIVTLKTQNTDPRGHCPTNNLSFHSLYSQESYLSI